jgi:branched-chain amino acid transport system permease protein
VEFFKLMKRLSHLWLSLPWLARVGLLFVLIFAIPPLMGRLEEATNFALLSQINRALIFVMLALGLNITVGFAGLLDLGYASFFAIGAYTFGVLTWPTHGIEASFFIAIWVAMAMAALMGTLVASPTLRLRGDYLAIVTLAFGEIIPTTLRNLDEFKLELFGQTLIAETNLTNGAKGMNPLAKPQFSPIESLLGLEAGSLRVGVDPVFWYFIILLGVALTLFIARRLEDSRIGRAWEAVREDETAAKFMGVNPVIVKLMAFAVGASFAGLAGAIYGSMLGAIFPDQFRFQLSIFLLVLVILGGIGNIYGVLVGAMLITFFDGVFLAQFLPEYAPDNFNIENFRWVFFGLGLVVVMLFRPQGLFPSKRRPLKRTSPAASAAD